MPVLFEETYAGLRVLDLSENIAGPLACLTFADMGADVIKLERPAHGDATRNLPPYWGGEATVFQTVNRNKRSVTIDIRSDAGRAAALEIVRTCDIVVESFRPGVAARLGLAFQDMVEIKPDLVHLSVNAFGTGPIGHDRPGYDALVQAFTGIMQMTGEPDGEPVRAAPSIIDISTGLWGALAIQAALVRRDASGDPQQLDASLIDSGFYLLCHQIMGFLGTGTSAPRLGSAAPSAAPYQVFSTADQPIMIATSTDRMYATLCSSIGRPELIEDPRYASMDDRLTHREELASEIQTVLVTRSADHWLTTLEATGVPVGPVNTLAEALEHPLTKERGLIAAADNGRIPDLLQVHLPMDRARSAPRRQAPALGHDTARVLAEVGLSPEAVSALLSPGTPTTRGTDLK